MLKVGDRLRDQPEFRFVCRLRGRVRPAMPNPHFHFRTVDPWVRSRPGQDPPDDEVPDPERAAWGQ
eukprot:11889681-Alexandrium_andersonii.AAC.1